MNLNNIFEITTISILIILYYLGVLMYLIFGYLFLVNDYNIANKCKDSNLWAFVLVNIIISTTGFIKLIVKKESVFEEFCKLVKDELSILISAIILTIFYSGFICWGGVELFRNSCDDLEKTSLWNFALFIFSYNTMWFVFLFFVILNYKKVNNFINGDENENNNDDQIDQMRNLGSQIDDIITRINSQNVQASPVTEVDSSQINITPTTNVEVVSI